MPFTLAHPAAILPLHARTLRGRRLPLAALVVGSMMPDLGYFFAPLPIFHADCHTLLRSFTFCLPFGLAVLALLTFLQPGWAPLLPEPLRPTRPLVAWSVRALPGLAAGLVLGAWTHIFWDAWTHPHGFFVRNIPALGATIAPGFAVCNVLQHASSVLGLAAIAFVARRRLRAVRLDWRVGFWAGALVLAIGVACADEVAINHRAALVQLVIMAVRQLVWIALIAALSVRAVKLMPRPRA
jgi:hypothetical protein